MQRIGNRIVKAVLRSRFHSMMSHFLVLLTYHGKRSGKAYTVPVGYCRDAVGVTVLVGRAGDKTWWRNLRGGAPVTLRLKGEDVTGVGRVVDGDDGERYMRAYLVDSPRAAKAFGLKLAAAELADADLSEAVQQIPVIRITLDR